MKRILSFLISCTMLFTSCGAVVNESSSSSEGNINTTTSIKTEKQTSIVSENTVNISSVSDIADDSADEITDIQEDYQPSFESLEQPELLQYVKDSVYTELVDQLSSDNYIIEGIQAEYMPLMPEEYYSELEFNSQENVYFGYKVSELNAIFNGTKYIFTLDENGQTTVKEMEIINDDVYDQIIKNVAIGTGVILVCVTVSIVSAGAGAPAVSLVFAASAKTATTFALSSAALGGVSSAFVKGIETRNIKEALKAGAIGASEDFKWGAISGAVIGGAKEGFKLAKSGKAVSEAVAEGNSTEIGRTGEEYAKKFYKGDSQVSYLKGEEVPYSTNNATRPDIVIKKPNGTVEAIEVKNYDLKKYYSHLENELKRQVEERVRNLPSGSTQKIALITKGRGYSKEFINGIVEKLQASLFDVYGAKIPIDIL